MNPKNIRLALLGIVLLILLTRFSSISVTMFDGDEGLSVIAGNVIVDGGLPYRDAIDHRGPVTYYLYGLIFMLFGKFNMQAVHAVFNIMVVLDALLIFYICRMVLNTQVGLWAAFTFSVVSWINQPLDMWAAHTEWPLIFFVLLGVVCFIRYRFEQRIWWLPLSGMCFSLGMLSKQIGAFDFIALVIFMFIQCIAQKESFAKLIKEYSLIGIGFLIPIALTFVHFYFHNGWNEFWFYFWEYNVKFYMTGTDMHRRLANIPHFLNLFFQNKIIFLAFYLAGIILILRSIRGRGEQEYKAAVFLVFICLWNIFSFIGAAWGGRYFQHYLIQFLPSFCIICGICIAAFFADLENSVSLKAFGGRAKDIFYVILFTAVFVPFVQMINLYFPYTFWEDKKNFSIENYIHDNTTPKDTIFVWGFNPEVYAYSKRMPASRFTYCNFLVGLIPDRNESHDIPTDHLIVPGSWDIFMAELEKNKPKFFVDSSPSNLKGYAKFPISRYPQLMEFLNKYYELDPDFAFNKLPHFPKPVYVLKKEGRFER